MSYALHHGDLLDVLARLEPDSIDAVVALRGPQSLMAAAKAGFVENV